MPRFAANLTFLFNEVAFLDRFGEAANAGFRAVEFAFAYELPAREIAARASGNGLEVVVINAPPGDFAAGERGTASLPGREHEFQAGFATALRYAKTLACSRIHVMAGVMPPEAGAEERARRRATLVRNLRYACDEAREQDVTVLLEALNPRDVPNYFYARQADVDAIRAEVDAPNLKLQLDLYHAQIVEGDLGEKLRRFLPVVGHVQIAGVPGRHEPDVGEVNYAWIFRQLDELRYDGWIGCEYRPLASTTAGLGWFYRLLDRKPARAERAGAS
jgi:hydroxypyruvate isomerase